MDESKDKFRSPIPLLQKWLINSLALLVASSVMRGMHFEDYLAVGVASLLLTLSHEFLRPILHILTLPLMILTLTAFRFVINALLIMLVGALVLGFQVDTFGAAFGGGLIISLIGTALGNVTGVKEREYEFQRRMRERRERNNQPKPPRDQSGGGSSPGGGPIIDV